MALEVIFRGPNINKLKIVGVLIYTVLHHWAIWLIPMIPTKNEKKITRIKEIIKTRKGNNVKTKKKLQANYSQWAHNNNP